MKKKTDPLMIKSTFFLAILLLSFSQSGRSEIIRLKNGNAIETKILKENEDFVIVQAPGGKVKIPKADIQMIWRGSAADLLTVSGKQVYFAKGLELYKEGQFQDAAEAFEQALGAGAFNAIIYANIGSAYASAGEIKKAEENFLKALEEKPDHPDTLLNLAHLYESTKDYEKAVSYYQKTITITPEASALKRNLAYCLYMAGNYLDAAKLFLGLGRKNDPVALCNASAAFIQAGQLDEASAILSNLIENPSPVPRTYLLMAEISRLRKDYSGAEDYYQKALKQDPDVAKVKIGLGQLYIATKDLEKAEAAFNEVLMKDPGSLGAGYGLARVLIQKEEFQKAIDHYEQLAEKNPDNQAIGSSIGLVYLKMNKPEAALRIFQKVLARNDQDAKAHTNAGLAYALINDADNALREWNRALELDPKLEPALRNKKLLEEVMQGHNHEKDPSA